MDFFISAKGEQIRGPNCPVKLTEDEYELLQQITRKKTEKQSIVLRANIILMASEETFYQDIAKKLSVQRNVITTWTTRWQELAHKPVLERLQDRPRPGAPDTFTPEQLCQIIAIACESPMDFKRPMTHWTHRELADEVMKQGIVDSISANHVGRLLKKTIYSHTAASIG